MERPLMPVSAHCLGLQRDAHRCSDQKIPEPRFPLGAKIASPPFTGTLRNTALTGKPT